MSIDTDYTPDDPISLKALVASQRNEIERLNLLVAKLQRLYLEVDPGSWTGVSKV